MDTSANAGTALLLDGGAVAELCRAHGVERLTLFGSVLADRFDVDSDVDLVVEFLPGVESRFEAYFGLKEGLEAMLGRLVDLVVASAIENPCFARSVASASRDLYLHAA